MPKYRIETNRGTFEVEANREPTADEVMAMLDKQQSPAKQPDAPAQQAARREVVPPGMLGNSFGIPIPTQSDMGIAPGMLADAGLEGGGAALGQAVGSLTPGPLKPAGMAAGRVLGGMAGNYAAQRRRVATGEQDGVKYGQMAGAGVAALVPGSNLAKAPVAALAKEGVKGAVSNVAALGAESAVDSRQLPSAGQAAVAAGFGAAAPFMSRFMAPAAKDIRAIEKAVLKDTVREVRAAGYPIDPMRLDPSWATKKLASVAGKASTAQEVALRASEVTTALARQEMGLPANTPLTREMLSKVRNEAAAPYRTIASLSPEAAEDVTALNLARSEARGYHKSYGATANYADLMKAKEADKRAEELQRRIGEHAVKYGDPGLVYELDAARTRIAKVHDFEDSLNLGDGNIAAEVLARKADAGKKLTGKSLTIAKYASAFPMDAREASRVQTPGVSQMGAYGSAAMGGLAAGQVGPRGLAAAGIPLLADPARAFLLSDRFQQRAVNRFLNPVQPESAIPLALRLGTMSAGRGVE